MRDDGRATQEWPVRASGGDADGLSPAGEGSGTGKRSRALRGAQGEHLTKIECCDCAKMPPFDDDTVVMANGQLQFRPKSPRKIDPRSTETHKASPRCTTHWRAWRDRQRAKGAAARSRKRSGLDEELRQELLAFQGGVCAGCGRPGTSKKNKVLSADHDHELAREHDHPEKLACELCMRGFLCSRCNRDILGLLMARPGATTDWAISTLENLASYLHDPPMARLLRERELAS